MSFLHISLCLMTVFSKVVAPVSPVAINPTKALKVCGTSLCDSDMIVKNANNGVWHLPNLIQVPTGLDQWSSNKVGDAKMTTINTIGTSNIKYGGFCAQSQKTIFFMGAFVPAGIPDPSWIAKIPVGDLDSTKNFKGGLSYKIDVSKDDIVNMNQAASTCKAMCSARSGCNFASYGWEAPGGWFCKLYSSGICTDPTTMWWKPAPPAFSVNSLGGIASSTAGFAGGCRVTDTISTTTPLLNPGISLSISPTTAYTAQLPYLNPVSYTSVDGIVTSLKCDVIAGGLTPGWPTFGTLWL